MTVLMILASVPAVYAQDATLGRQVGAERRSAGGGRVREFEKGAVYWSRTTGSHTVSGAALAKYKGAGAEGGALGYPVSDASAMKDGLRQTFEHGFITTTAAGEARVRLISGVTFTESALTIQDAGIRLLENPTIPGVLALESQALPVTNVSCGCVSMTVIGTCMVKISNKGKTATCTGKGCNCMFSVVEDTFK